MTGHRAATMHASPAGSRLRIGQLAPLPGANWVATVCHGIPVEAFPFQPVRGDYLAFLGRIAPEKGLDTAIDVARRAGLPRKVAARMPLDQAHNPEARRNWRYVHEVIEHGLTGFVADCADGLVRAVGRLAEIDRHRCRATAETRFSTGAMVDQYEAIYRRLLGRAAAPTTPAPHDRRESDATSEAAP